ncbi:MAG: hypothetical protein H6831_11335 [Planctomycetes bacterium]|nr:hypothetical protein [Planctomycetota bacterium]
MLDGTPKKPKLIECFSGDLPPHTPEFAKQRRAALKAVFKRVGKGLDNLGVALDVRGAAFRRQNVPLSDTSKIESVLKYEVEGQLPQFNIDDVSVDWMVLDQAGDSSSLLVTAVPKDLLAQVIEDCTRAGAEPMELELETSAMVNAAQSAGLLTLDSAQLLVHVGEASTAVAVVDGGKVRELRAIHIGALAPDAPEPEAPAAEPTVPDALAEGGEEGAEAAEEPERQWTPARVVSGHQLDEVLSRISRELARTVSGARTVNTIDKILVCGYRLPGMLGTDVMGVPVEALEGFPIEEGATQFHNSGVVAYGAALSRLGGGSIHAKLRRDELAYTGTMERLELPLAVVALLLVTFLGVQQIFLRKEIKQTHDAIGSWRDSSNNYMLGDPKKGKKGNLVNPKEPKLDNNGNVVRVDGVEQRVGRMDGLVNYVNNFCGSVDGKFVDDEQMPDRVAQLKYIEGQLKKGINDVQKELGQVSDVPQPPSALHGLSLVLGTLADNMDAEGWRPSFRRLRATSNDRKGKDSTVEVTIDLSLFGESDTEARRDYESWLSRIEAQPWCLKVDRRATTPLENGKGIATSGLKISVDPKKAEVL